MQQYSMRSILVKEYLSVKTNQIMINMRNAVILVLLSCSWLLLGCSSFGGGENQSSGNRGSVSSTSASQDSYDADGYDANGYDADGLDKNGYDKNGRSAEGYDGNGYDVHGFNDEGYNVEGYDEAGFDRNGRLKGGTYRAAVDYYNPATKVSKPYNLDVNVENGEITAISFPNNGYLNDDTITPAQVDNGGYAKIYGQEGRVYEVQIEL